MAQKKYKYSAAEVNDPRGRRNIKSRTTTSPPAHVEGNVYLVPSGATGEWSSHAGELAGSDGTSWIYEASPPGGSKLWVEDEGVGLVHDGSAFVVADNPEKTKTVTIENPTSSEDISILFTGWAITISRMRAVVRGSSPSVTWTIRHGTSRSGTGAEVVTGGTTTTNQSSGSDVSTFNDATIVADSFVWLETTAQSGTVNELSVTICYKED